MRTMPALKRSAPLRRRTRLKPRRVKPRRSSASRDREYLAAVRGLPCLLATEFHNCAGPIEAHHAGTDHGLGAKGSDYCAVPICRTHHRQWTDHAGLFRDMDKDVRRVLAGRWIARTQARLGLTQEPTP